MRLIILGAPGAGKGTQAVRIADRLEIPHLASGEMLRAAVTSGTGPGQAADEVMRSGGLVPDEIMLDIIGGRLGADDTRRGFVLDGFPRTIAQAHGLDRMLAGRGEALDAVLEIRVDENALLNRILIRAREAAERGAPVRKDDNPETVRNRLETYARETRPLIDFYGARGSLRSVDGMAPIDEVSRQLVEAIGA